MFRKAVFTSIFSLLLWCGVAQAADLLDGDERLACEAVLCLSSPVRPGECAAALARYFGINFKKWSDTVTARRNFLNLCPTASETDVLRALNSVLSEGSGRCEVSDLNARGQWITHSERLRVEDCQGRTSASISGRYDETWEIVYYEYDYNRRPDHCLHTITYWQVNTVPPGYCTAIWNNELTDYSNRPRVVHGPSNQPWETRWQ